jgi:hypothetical protein
MGVLVGSDNKNKTGTEFEDEAKPVLRADSMQN